MDIKYFQSLLGVIKACIIKDKKILGKWQCLSSPELEGELQTSHHYFTVLLPVFYSLPMSQQNGQRSKHDGAISTIIVVEALSPSLGFSPSTFFPHKRGKKNVENQISLSKMLLLILPENLKKSNYFLKKNSFVVPPKPVFHLDFISQEHGHKSLKMLQC